MSSKLRMLEFLMRRNPKMNRFTVNQAKSIFNMERVTARVHELRQEGWPIKTRVGINEYGENAFVYSMPLSRKNRQNVRRFAVNNGLTFEKAEIINGRFVPWRKSA